MANMHKKQRTQDRDGFVYTFQFLVYLNALSEHVYCCFTRTTLFTTMFTVIIVVCSLKSMCVPSFIVIGYCVSELHSHYCNILPEAVYCCYTRTTLFTNFFTCLYDQSLRLLSYHQALLLYTLCFLRYNIAKCIARGCLLLF